MRFQSFTVLTSTTAEVTARPAEPVAQYISDVIVDSPEPTSVSILDGSGVTIARIPAPGSASLRTPLEISPGRALVIQSADSLNSVAVTLLGEINNPTRV